jgi:hypothetical protein
MEISNYVLGIHSNVKSSAGFTDGHAWITITTKVGKGHFVKSYGQTVTHGRKIMAIKPMLESAWSLLEGLQIGIMP